MQSFNKKGGDIPRIHVAGEEQHGKWRTPGDFLRAVSEYSSRTKYISLHPGPHYRSLALFLKGPSYNRTTAYSRASTGKPYAFASLHDLSINSEDPRHMVQFNETTGLQKFANVELPSNDTGQLLFLRGWPSPEWLNLIGARYRVDPEFFRRHLSLGRSRDFYDLPALPSSSENIVKLAITSIGRRNGRMISRQEGPEAVRSHFHALSANSGTIGDSVVRRFSLHDEEHFSIEQDVSICVLKRGRGWMSLILLDNGRNLDEGPGGPWLDGLKASSSFEDVFAPVIQFEHTICFKAPVQNANDTPSSSQTSMPESKFAQSAALLPTSSYGRFLDPALMKIDAFYALHELFAFAVYSENQFLNLCRAKLDAESYRLHDEENMQQSLSNLRYHKLIIHDHIERLQETLEVVKSRGSAKWPCAKPPLQQSDHSAPNQTLSVPSDQASASKKTLYQETLREYAMHQKETNRAASQLLQDYSALIDKAKLLSQLYSESMEDIRNRAMLLESKKAIGQAQGVARLTLLAFFFIPLSFTSSFFGMNFREIGDQLSIWIWFVTSIPVFGVALLLLFWKDILRAFRQFRTP